MIKRYLMPYIIEDLLEKMVFIGGPRQVGKTTLALSIGESEYTNKFSYYNWDKEKNKNKILDADWPAESKLVILDEIHKYERWKNFVKGEHDTGKDIFRIMVTGSAKMDIYKHGGDSMQGRYFSYRLHPLSVAELSMKDRGSFKEFSELQFGKFEHSLFESLYHFGGFPEPYEIQNDRSLKRWHRSKLERLVYEDIEGVQFLKTITDMGRLVELLPSKVGSLFSLNSLREDLQVSHPTMSAWVEILEKFYYHFRIYPFVNKLNGSYKKEPKLFLWDWSEIDDKGARLENMVASHLFKFCHFLHDVEGFDIKLNFLKNKPSHEVDFLVTIKNVPWFCVEVKNSIERNLTSLKYYGSGLKIPYKFQVVNVRDIDHYKDGIRVMSAEKFLTGLV